MIIYHTYVLSVWACSLILVETSGQADAGLVPRRTGSYKTVLINLTRGKKYCKARFEPKTYPSPTLPLATTGK